MFSNRFLFSTGRCLLSQIVNKNSRFISFAIVNNRNILLSKDRSTPILIIKNELIHLKASDYKKDNKKKGSSGGREEENEDEDDDDDMDEGEKMNEIIKNIDTSDFPKGFKITSRTVSSLRIDAVLAAGIGISRNKIDDQFYGSKLRVNEQKILKKAIKAKEGDVLDLLVDKAEDGSTVSKRVIVYKIFDEKSSNDRHKVILIAWKGGIKTTSEEKKQF